MQYRKLVLLRRLSACELKVPEPGSELYKKKNTLRNYFFQFQFNIVRSIFLRVPLSMILIGVIIAIIIIISLFTS